MSFYPHLNLNKTTTKGYHVTAQSGVVDWMRELKYLVTVRPHCRLIGNSRFGTVVILLVWELHVVRIMASSFLICFSILSSILKKPSQC